MGPAFSFEEKTNQAWLREAEDNHDHLYDGNEFKAQPMFKRCSFCSFSSRLHDHVHSCKNTLFANR